MSERLYTKYPQIYDAIQSEWDYDRDISFLEEVLTRQGVDGDRLLEIGCGTGEHTKRLVATGFDVTAVDKYDGMLDVARTKCDADFRQATIPDLPVEGEYDAAVAIRGVVNHLAPDALGPALDAIENRLADGGPLVFDNSALPADGNDPALDLGTTEGGEYARVSRHVPISDDRLEWQSVVFTSEGECFVNSRPMTPFDDATIHDALVARKFDVETHEGYGPDDRRTVFVARS